MKLSISILFLILLTFSCNKEEEVELEAFSPEAFAYDIGNAWEVNTTVNVKGFVKKEAGEDLSTSLDYFVDLMGPDSLLVESIFADSKEVTDEELIDVQLEAQFELDYDAPEGMYTLTFSIIDNNSGEKTSAQAEFELKK